MHLCCLVCRAWAKCLSMGSSWLTPVTSHANGLSKPGTSSKGPATCLEHHPEQAPCPPWDSSPSFSFISLDFFFFWDEQEIKWVKTMPTALPHSTTHHMNEVNGRNMQSYSSNTYKNRNSCLFPGAHKHIDMCPSSYPSTGKQHQSIANSVFVYWHYCFQSNLRPVFLRGSPEMQ